MLSRFGNVDERRCFSAMIANGNVHLRAVVLVNVMTPRCSSKIRQNHPDVIVIGAGIAGLTAAALLAARGLRVQVLEQHTVAGGCASYFIRGGYRFDVGATLVSGFGPRGVHRLLFERLGVDVAVRHVEPAMEVHVAGDRVRRFGDARWRPERLRAFGPAAEPFWEAQEQIADLAWDFSTRFPALPVDISGLGSLIAAIRPRQLALVGAIGKTIAHVLPVDADAKLRAFVDAQLLITSQADAATTDLAYGATALDIAREGTFHLPAGVSGIAIALARAVRRAGGEIAYGTAADALLVERGRVAGVRLAEGAVLRAPATIAAIPVLNVLRMLGSGAAGSVESRLAALPQRWGAFMAYVGLPAENVPADCALHHQLVFDEHAPLGEGNSVFISFSAPDEPGRARSGGRAVTISTHTDVAGWERAYAAGTYEQRKREYGGRLRAALERIVPGAWDRAEVIEFATPRTFARYTGRARGLVGGLPQTSATANLRALSHRSGIAGLTLCGDSIFPGQSTVGASLSGTAAANAIKRD
jgi:C-3',4' desaturase CrtD